MLDINVRDNAEFASDFLPYMKILIPHEVSSALGDVYSNYSSHLNLSGGSVNNDNDVSVERRENSSRNILEYDDIEDSDDETPSNDLISPKKRKSPVRKSEPEVIVIDSDSD
jgi:hypothetical protein